MKVCWTRIQRVEKCALENNIVFIANSDDKKVLCMEWLVVFGVFILVGANYQKIVRKYYVRKNLKGLMPALEGSDAAKLFYVAYFGLIKANAEPHIQVSMKEGVLLPKDLSSKDTVCLNISPESMRYLIFKNETLSFSTCFNKTSYKVEIPLNAIECTYSEVLGVAFGRVAVEE